MLRTRIIPCLLLKDGGLVKTARFSQPTYVGDPINAVKIFNEKHADELLLLDIEATVRGKSPDLHLLRDIGEEAQMPLGYGGGIRSPEDVRAVLAAGFEKVVLNSAALADRTLIRRSADLAGSQSIVAAIDVKQAAPGRYEVRSHSGTRPTGLDPVDYALQAQKEGAGEILVNSIDRDGSGEGYDLDLLRRISAAVTVPVIALGGASSLKDLREVVTSGGASAAAAGSLFVFHGKHRAVLINYPDPAALDR